MDKVKMMFDYLKERISEASNITARIARAGESAQLRFNYGIIDAYEDVQYAIETGKLSVQALDEKIDSYKKLENQYWNDEESRSFYNGKKQGFENFKFNFFYTHIDR